MKETHTSVKLPAGKIKNLRPAFTSDLKKTGNVKTTILKTDLQQYVRRRYSLDDNGGGYIGL